MVLLQSQAFEKKDRPIEQFCFILGRYAVNLYVYIGSNVLKHCGMKM